MSRYLVSQAERSHKDFFLKKNNNSSQRELGPPVLTLDLTCGTVNHNAAGLVQLELLTWCSAPSPCPAGSTYVACMHHTPVK